MRSISIREEQKQNDSKVMHSIIRKNLHQLDGMLDEEWYNKHHDDELYLEMVDSDEMMLKEHQ
jgi:hypothetical protein